MPSFALQEGAQAVEVDTNNMNAEEVLALTKVSLRCLRALVVCSACC